MTDTRTRTALSAFSPYLLLQAKAAKHWPCFAAGSCRCRPVCCAVLHVLDFLSERGTDVTDRPDRNSESDVPLLPPALEVEASGSSSFEAKAIYVACANSHLILHCGCRTRQFGVQCGVREICRGERRGGKHFPTK